MALYKDHTSNNGIVSKYHKIDTVHLNEFTLLCRVASYANKEYRDNNERPVAYNTYNFQYSVEEEESMGIRKLCYMKLKALANWQDAEDC